MADDGRDTRGERRLPSGRAVALALAFTAALGACQPAGADTRLTVFAASSLRGVFETLGARFEALHPGVEVAFAFSGTQVLAAQLAHGADADVFAAADATHLRDLVTAGRLMTPVSFARNKICMIVAREHASTLRHFGDLARAESVALGEEVVPVGRYARQTMDDFVSNRQGLPGWRPDFVAEVARRTRSRELAADQVVARVVLGEAAAGLVWCSDAAAVRGQVSVVPGPGGVVATYPMAVLADSPRQELAAAWVALVRSGEGRAVLARAGFEPIAPEGAP